MEKGKKKNMRLIVFLVLLILIILGLVGYICYDKKLIFNDNKAVSTSNKLEKEQNLDINSRLVQTLYNSVTSRDEFCFKYSIYGKVQDDDYIVDEVSEKDKMALVKHNLKNNYYETVSCTDVNVPDTLSINVNGNDINYYSSCSVDPNADQSTPIEQRFIEKEYSKEYVETIYKSLFGKDAKLDTNVPITSYGPEVYVYNKDIDSYIKYAFAGGGTCGPVKYKDKIEKAVLKGDTLKIYEKTDVTTGPDDTYDSNGNLLKHEDATTSTNYHVYTFLRESDGMYKFVSRIKESK